MNDAALTVLPPDADPSPAPRGLRRLQVDDWAVAVVQLRPHDLVTVGRRLPVHGWLSNPPGCFLADPAWLEGRVVAERYDHRRRIGDLITVEPGGGPVRPLGAAAHHRSYPCVVSHHGRPHVVCEETSTGALTLYRPDGERLEAVADLVPGLGALDPTIAEVDGRWWLWCADAAGGPYSTRSQVFTADGLTGPWRLVTELEASTPTLRPGGPPFTVDGALYRPVQDCRGGYGRRVIVRQVWADPADYREREVAVLELVGGPRRAGMHTLAVHPDGDRALIDAKRLRWSVAAATRVVRTRLSGASRR